mgnify:CR=1 FL=1
MGNTDDGGVVIKKTESSEPVTDRAGEHIEWEMVVDELGALDELGGPLFFGLPLLASGERDEGGGMVAREPVVERDEGPGDHEPAGFRDEDTAMIVPDPHHMVEVVLAPAAGAMWGGIDELMAGILTNTTTGAALVECPDGFCEKSPWIEGETGFILETTGLEAGFGTEFSRIAGF